MSAYAYFPGCSLHATAREYDESIRAVADALKIGLNEIEDWCCCGATPAHALDPRSAQILGLWNLAHASKGQAGPVLTGCASCFSRLRAVKNEIQEREEHIRGAREALGLDIDPRLEILHVAQVLAGEEIREEIKARLSHPLKGLRVACYYGCLLTRPRGAGAVDDVEAPRILEDLVELVGAEAVDWPLRLDCCGASMAMPRPDLVRELSGKILMMAHERGAKVLMVACPLCHSNLDFQQEAILRELGQSFRIPVLYLTQLVGLALGIDPGRLGLGRHFVPVPVRELVPAEGASCV
ncbi:MAG: heterodisulfide reductase subunit B [Candidatus Eisenbacteria bacterium]|nr:heterodisulfide reductase subunit B [Candidatus Eisenbacteria bacterium]